MEKTTVYNLVVLDESGSMDCIKQQTINGFNETIQTIATAQQKFQDQHHLVSLVNFNSENIRTILELAPIDQAAQLNANTYQPNNGTPLYDALGISLSKLRLQIDGKTEHQVLVTIITDGEENSSKEFTGQMIKKMIDELKVLGWVFSFIGANIDVEKAAAQISVNNYISFNQTNEGTQAMFAKEAKSRMNLYDRMSKKESKDKLAEKYFEE
jgi:hypothetical protein